MSLGTTQQARAVASGHWPLFRFDPRAQAAGRNPMTLDSRPPKISFTDYAYAEGRYNILRRIDPATAARLAEQAQQDVAFRWHLYQQLAALHAPRGARAMPEPSPEPAG
jgi:pyruvate-ferredoxin/flavodoxin oxidoreductase